MASLKLPLAQFPFSAKQQNNAYPFKAKRYGSGKRGGMKVGNPYPGQTGPPPTVGGSTLTQTTMGNMPQENTSTIVPRTSDTTIGAGLGDMFKPIFGKQTGDGESGKGYLGRNGWVNTNQDQLTPAQLQRLGPRSNPQINQFRREMAKERRFAKNRVKANTKIQRASKPKKISIASFKKLLQQ